MNKKGFVFVETIIVIAVLTTVLLMLYASFISIINQERRNTTFDDATYIYRTYYIEDFLVSLNLDEYINTHLETENNVGNKPLLATFTCHDDSLYNLYDENGNLVVEESNKKDFCEYLIDGGRMEIDNVYITRYNIKDLVNCTNNDNDITCKGNPELRNLSPNAISYFRSLSGDKEEGYRLIIEYKSSINNKDHYLYSNVEIVKRDNINKQPDDQEESKEYTIITNIDDNATVNPVQESVIEGSNSRTFTISLKEGYLLDEITCNNDIEPIIVGNTFKIENINNDIVCNIKTKREEYTVSLKFNPLNAATIDNANIKVIGDNDGLFTINLTNNYHIEGITCTNEQVASFEDNVITVNKVTKNTVCTVNLQNT